MTTVGPAPSEKPPVSGRYETFHCLTEKITTCFSRAFTGSRTGSSGDATCLDFYRWPSSASSARADGGYRSGFARRLRRWRSGSNPAWPADALHIS